MTIKFDALRAGDVLYYVHRQSISGRCGRGYGMSRECVDEVRVVDVDAMRRCATCVKNGRSRIWFERQLNGLRRSKPKMKL